MKVGTIAGAITAGTSAVLALGLTSAPAQATTETAPMLAPASASTANASAPAKAPTKTFKLKQGKDYGWVKYYTKNGRRKVQIGVCDKEWDANTVYGEFWNGSHRVTKSDGNGQGGGCYKTSWPVTKAYIHEFRICEDDWGSDTCTKWKKTEDPA